MLRLGVKKGNRALRAIGYQASDLVVLDQKHEGAKNNGDPEHSHTQSPGQQAINGLFLNGLNPRFAVQTAL